MTTDDEVKYRFCDLATQYYISGRLAARAAQAPVYGNLLHHAVEMYLKGALVGTLTLAQMKKQPYSHDMRALWTEFKASEKDNRLDRFDSTIEALHAFESIRYPDEILAKGMVVAVTWKAADDAMTASGTIKMPPKYEVIMEHIDELVIEILERASVNPKAIPPAMFPAAQEALAYQNVQASKWAR